MCICNDHTCICSDYLVKHLIKNKIKQAIDNMLLYIPVGWKESNEKLELSRAHTPRALSICRFLHRDRPVMLTISTSPVVGMVDGRGYDGRQKDTICDIRGPCLTNRSTFKPVCRWFRLIGHIYKLLRCLDIEIWRFSWWQQTDGQTDRQTDYFTPAHAREVMNSMKEKGW